MLNISRRLFNLCNIGQSLAKTGFSPRVLRSELTLNNVSGRGAAGTTKSCVGGMVQNVARVIEEGKQNRHKRGCEIEAAELKALDNGKNTSSH